MSDDEVYYRATVWTEMNFGFYGPPGMTVKEIEELAEDEYSGGNWDGPSDHYITSIERSDDGMVIGGVDLDNPDGPASCWYCDQPWPRSE